MTPVGKGGEVACQRGQLDAEGALAVEHVELAARQRGMCSIEYSREIREANHPN